MSTADDSPSNIQASSTTPRPTTPRFIETTTPSRYIETTTPSNAIRLDPRTFVECSHVETEMFEDYFESPSNEALQLCQKYGVTLQELERGIARNPEPEQQRFDLANLYVPCEAVFSSAVEYMTSELRDDFNRCKRLRALSPDVQEKIERQFYELIFGVTTSRPGPPTPIPTTTESGMGRETTTSPPIIETTTERIPETTLYPVPETTTEARRKRPRAFANCQPIENTIYLVCIKVIKVYATPLKLQ